MMRFIKAIVRNFWFPLGVMLAFGVISLLGYLGWTKYYQTYHIERNVSEIAYSTLQLFTIDVDLRQSTTGNAELQWAMFLAPLLVAYTALQSVYFLLYERLQILSRQFLKNHVIVCGFGKRGEALARSFRSQGQQVVVIDLAEHSGIHERCQKTGALMLTGQAESEVLLREARLDSACYLFAVCGNERINADIAVISEKLSQQRQRGKLTCFIHISHKALHRLLIEKMLTGSQASHCRIELFNLSESAALALIREYPPLPIRVNAKDLAENHFIVVGDSLLAENLIIHFARLWWENRDKNESFSLTWVAPGADAHVKQLYARYPALSRVCKITASNGVDTGTIVDGVIASVKRSTSKIYVCPGNTTDTLTLALELREHLKACPSKIIAVVEHSGGLSALCQSATDNVGSKEVIIFPTLDRTCSANPLLASTRERLGQAIHEDYILQQCYTGPSAKDNPAMVSWENLPESLRESNRQQADDIGAKLDLVKCCIEASTDWETQRFNFSPEEIEKLARMEHERWLQERRASGWQYGSAKNIEEKISPFLILWEQLPESEKEKDRDTVRNLPLVIGLAGFRIVRKLSAEDLSTKTLIPQNNLSTQSRNVPFSTK